MTFLTHNAPLVGLSGYARSGKDSSGAALVADGWDRLAFGDTLREFLLAINPVVLTRAAHYSASPRPQRLRALIDQFGWEAAKDNIAEVRELLQRTGTEAGRGVIGENVWIDATLRRLRSGIPAVITDVRFPSDADAVRRLGGVVVRVNRPGVGPKNSHASETALDGYAFDWWIENDSTVEVLHARVRDFVSGHLRYAAA